MTQEDKQLLLVDLCARLPHGVMIQNLITKNLFPLKVVGILHRTIKATLPPDKNYNLELEKVKPYLRPMSSMTEEERKEYHRTFFYHERYDNEHKTGQNCSITFETYDWLNKHHFDYRGLIKKGLALEAPKDIYNLNLDK